MKAKAEQVTPVEVFKPIVLTITIETPQELEMWYQLGNQNSTEVYKAVKSNDFDRPSFSKHELDRLTTDALYYTLSGYAE